jgi:hypothetical protein
MLYHMKQRDDTVRKEGNTALSGAQSSWWSDANKVVGSSPGSTTTEFIDYPMTQRSGFFQARQSRVFEAEGLRSRTIFSAAQLQSSYDI